jgi:hypothetical protein
MGCKEMNLGHAFRTSGASMTDEVEEVVRIVRGDSELAPRAPLDPKAVTKAEALLGVNGGVVYTFAGCLHPSLGTVGIVIAAECWRRLLDGATRCDSGGLAGGHGAFSNINESDRDDILVSLSYLGPHAKDWRPAFDDEVVKSYREPEAYISGEVPNYAAWTDPRADCFQNYDRSKWPPDRRLWTWEVRLGGSPRADEIVAVVFSHEAFKHVEVLRARNELIPLNIRVIAGDISPSGVHYFSDPVVSEMLCG